MLWLACWVFTVRMMERCLVVPRRREADAICGVRQTDWLVELMMMSV